MTIGKLSGQCDFGQKGQSYCNQRGQSCVAKRVKVAWLFHVVLVLVWSGLRMRVSYMENKGTGILFYFLEQYPRPFVLTIFNPIKYVRSVF